MIVASIRTLTGSGVDLMTYQPGSPMMALALGPTGGAAHTRSLNQQSPCRDRWSSPDWLKDIHAFRATERRIVRAFGEHQADMVTATVGLCGF